MKKRRYGYTIIIKFAENLDPTESCGDEYDIRAISPRILNPYSARRSLIFHFTISQASAAKRPPGLLCLHSIGTPTIGAPGLKSPGGESVSLLCSPTPHFFTSETFTSLVRRSRSGFMTSAEIIIFIRTPIIWYFSVN